METFSQILTLGTLYPQTIVMLCVLVVLLCISAVVSGSETAFFSLSPANILHLRNSQSRSDKTILKLVEDPDYLLATILIINNLVNICIVIISDRIIEQTIVFQSPMWAFIFKVVVVTFMLLLFGEIMPKVFAAYDGVRFSRIGVVLIAPLRTFVKPLSYVLIKFGNRVSGTFARQKVSLSMDDLSSAIEIANPKNEDEKQILTGIVSFVNTEASSIMKPRMDVVALDVESDFDQVRSVIIESGYSRIPVYEGNMDNIKGVLYVKDMMKYIDQSSDFEWNKYLRKAYFIPENKKIHDLMEEFQTTKVHMAIVVDEYGSTQGIVSLEDILEEVVGEITDESDTEESDYFKKLEDGAYLFDGKTHVSDFADVMQLDMERLEDVRGYAETLSGLMIEIKGNFLKKGESVVVEGVRLTAQTIESKRIDKVHAKRVR